MRKYRVTYLIEGIEKVDTTYARDEKRAVSMIKYIESISESFIDFAVLKIEIYHNEKYYKVNF